MDKNININRNSDIEVGEYMTINDDNELVDGGISLEDCENNLIILTTDIRCEYLESDYFRLPTIVQYPWMANIDIPNNVTIKTK